MKFKALVSLTAAAALSSASVAYAGGIAPVAIEPMVFEADDDAGSFGSLGGNGALLVGGLLLAGALAFALSDDDTASDDDDGGTAPLAK